MNKHKFNLGNVVKYKATNYRVTAIHGKFFGTCTYDITSIKATTAQETTLKEVPENFLKKIETVSG